MKIKIQKLTVLVDKSTCPMSEDQKFKLSLGYFEKNSIRCNSCHYFASFVMGCGGMPENINCNYK